MYLPENVLVLKFRGFLFVWILLCSGTYPIDADTNVTCARYSTSFVTCRYITSEQELSRAVSENWSAKDFTISKSSLRFINYDAFIGTEVRDMTIQETSLLSLSNKLTAFDGLENILTYFRIVQCSFVSHWNWNHLKNHRKLQLLLVRESEIDYLDSFPKLPLEYVEFSRTMINNISPEGFSNLEKLSSLLLHHNSISVVKRSFFPKPAKHLKDLNLGYNKIRLLPADIFTEMPVLEELILEKNELHTISEVVFTPVYKQLKQLRFLYNPLICDCRLKWILKMGTKPQILKFGVFSRGLNAKCSFPKNLEGKAVENLVNSDLWC